jgi:hypothetical protein
MAKRSEEPRRHRSARSDAKVESIEREIERTFGLPGGSVQLNNPGGTNARGDQKMKKFRDKYEKGEK